MPHTHSVHIAKLGSSQNLYLRGNRKIGGVAELRCCNSLQSNRDKAEFAQIAEVTKQGILTLPLKKILLDSDGSHILCVCRIKKNVTMTPACRYLSLTLCSAA